ncbi:MAG: S-adenosylmethionine:tRNA ribosyltransferase-isomerase [Eubacteriales bacterium]|nr:S-adenosylmethionine:tRNA ribosyltransferase-isomerase [Eubacteriales bacterium]MDN5364188.1 S-adenosylmethionine:tRNA ribosyltransferase-isomerase [Eubacteriales bacterium]
MRVDDFDYHLPEELIAQEPLPERDSSRLMVVHRQSGLIEHRQFRQIVDYLRPGDVLVLNETRVLPARLLGKREDTGGKVEVLLLHPRGNDRWEVLVRPGKKVKPGTTVVFGGGLLRARVEETTPVGGRVVQFEYEGNWEQLLPKIGEVPLPPYIKKKLPDPERYQTVYGRVEGSAAAPTAGLHFTPALLHKIRQQGIIITSLILHVGLGTFRPVKVERVEDHRMHAEYYEIPPETAAIVNQARREGRRVIAVGTTCVRALETAAGEKGEITPGKGWTDIFIYPGYKFRAIDALVTNFHLPRSTLLMLVAAFAGYELIMEAYRQAVAERYRFFSFGDAMLIL